MPVTEEGKPVTEETKITIRFWVIVGLILSALLGLAGTAFTHRERIVALETATPYNLKIYEGLQTSINEIKADLKEHIRYTKNGGR